MCLEEESKPNARLSNKGKARNKVTCFLSSTTQHEVTAKPALHWGRTSASSQPEHIRLLYDARKGIFPAVPGAEYAWCTASYFLIEALLLRARRGISQGVQASNYANAQAEALPELAPVCAGYTALYNLRAQEEGSAEAIADHLKVVEAVLPGSFSHCKLSFQYWRTCTGHFGEDCVEKFKADGTVQPFTRRPLEAAWAATSAATAHKLRYGDPGVDFLPALVEETRKSLDNNEGEFILKESLRGQRTPEKMGAYSQLNSMKQVPQMRSGSENDRDATFGDFQSFQRPAPVEDRSVCRHFLEGKCNYGDACRFSHAGFPLTPPVLQPEPFMPALSGTPANDRSVCRHFLEGKCTYGNACRFSHQGSAEDSTAWPAAPSAKVVERPTCRHFLEGKCSYGDACRFSHEDGLVNDAQPTVDDRSVCRHFLEGKCTYGSACRFLHTGDTRGPAPEPFWPPA
ncbi:HUA1, partial [Symbiodinium sp. CCMP2592]